MTRWKRTTVRTDDDEAGLLVFSGKAIDAHSASAVPTYTSVDKRVKSKVFSGLNVKTKDSPTPRKGFTEEELESQYEALACVWKKVPKEEPSPTVRVQTPTTRVGSSAGAGLSAVRPMSRGAYNTSASSSLLARPLSSAFKDNSLPRPHSRGPTTTTSTFSSNAPEPPPLTRAQVTQPIEETVKKMQQESLYGGSIINSWGTSVPFTKVYDSDRQQQKALDEMRGRWVTKKENASGHAPILIEDTPMIGGLQRAWATAEVQLAPFKAFSPASGAPAQLRQTPQQLQQLKGPKQEVAGRYETSSSEDEGYLQRGVRRTGRRRRQKTDRQTSALVKEIDRFEGTNPDAMLPAHFQKLPAQAITNNSVLGSSSILDHPLEVSRPSSGSQRRQANQTVLTFDESSDEEYFLERQAAKDALEQSIALRPVALGPNGKPLKSLTPPVSDKKPKYVVEKRAKDSLQQFNALMGQPSLGASTNIYRPPSSSVKVEGAHVQRSSITLSGTANPPDLASIVQNPSFAGIEAGGTRARRAVGFQSMVKLNRTSSVVVHEPAQSGPLFYATDAVDILRELYRVACPLHQDREDAYVQALGGLSFPMSFKKFKDILRRMVHQATGGNAVVVGPGSFAKPSLGGGGTTGSFVYDAALANHTLSSPSNGKPQARLVIPDDVYRAMYTFIVEKAQSLTSIPSVNATHSPKNTVGLPPQLSPVIPYVGYLHGVAQCWFSAKQLSFTHDLYHNMRNSPHINYYLYHLRHRVYIRAQRRLTRQLKLVQRIHALTEASTDAKKVGSNDSSLTPTNTLGSTLAGGSKVQKDGDIRTVDELRNDLLSISTDPQRLLTLSAGLEYSMLGDPIEEGAKARLWYQKRNYLLLAQHAEHLAGEMNATGAGRSSQHNGQSIMGRSHLGLMSGGGNNNAKMLRRKTEEEILDEALRELERKLELIHSSAADTFKTNAAQGRAGEIKDQLLLSIFLPKKVKPSARVDNINPKTVGQRNDRGKGKKAPVSEQGSPNRSHTGTNRRQTFEIEGFSFDEVDEEDSDADSEDSQLGGSGGASKGQGAHPAGASNASSTNGYEATKFATFVVRDVVFNLRNVSLQFPHPEEDAFVNAVVQCLSSTALDTATALVTDEASARQRKDEELLSKAKQPTISHSIAAMTGDVQTCAVSETEQGKQSSLNSIDMEYRAPLHPPPLSYLSLDDFRMLLFCDDRAMAALELVCPADKTVVDGVFTAYR